MNKIFTGNAVSKGTAVGKTVVIAEKKTEIYEFTADPPEKNLEIFRFAQKEASLQLEKLSQNALENGLFEAQALFEVHAELCIDADFTECTEELIMQGKSPAFAVQNAGKQFAERFEALNDEYLRERSRDVIDVANRICSIICGNDEAYVLRDERCIVISADLTPSQTLMLDRSKIVGFAVVGGSPLAHTAMLARSLGVPCLMNISDNEILSLNGENAIIDGDKGILNINPDADLLAAYVTAEAQRNAERAELLKYKECECRYKNGTQIGLFCNISSVEDAKEAMKVCADGVGLCRSEFLFPDTFHAPTEEEQFCIYRRILKILDGKPLTVRTFDIGSDKTVDWIFSSNEQNPALGVRGIRLALSNPDILRTQLTALLRASAFGKINIMLPMISDLREVSEVKKIIEEIKTDLRKHDIGYDENVTLGIMIETPSAAIMSDVLAQNVDFFSIGTNDLTQYTLAADRQNSVLAKQFTHRNEAVLRLIQLTAENAGKYGIPVSVCGEAAADLEITEKLLNFGIKALSVPPAIVLPLKKHIITD